jgi:hypothetical protein
MGLPGHILIHNVVVISRTGAGTFNDYNQEDMTESESDPIAARISPLSGEELVQFNEAGVNVTDHKMRVNPTTIAGSDVVRFDPDDGRRYEVVRVRDAAGMGHHLVVDLRMVTD